MGLKSCSFTSKEPHVAREPQVADRCHNLINPFEGLCLSFLDLLCCFSLEFSKFLEIVFRLRPHIPFLVGDDNKKSWNVLKILKMLDFSTSTAVAISHTVIEVRSFQTDYFRMLPRSTIHLWTSKSNTWYTECKIIITSWHTESFTAELLAL